MKVKTEKFNRKDTECEEDMKIGYEFNYSKILATLLVRDTITNQLRDIENLKFMEHFNLCKFKECENNFPNFLFRLSAPSL